MFYHGLFAERAVYYGWAMERVVERGVLPWIDGRRGGSRIFDYEMVFVDKVILGFEVLPNCFSLRNGGQNGW